LLDCVSCQQCRLHGKLQVRWTIREYVVSFTRSDISTQLMGLGAALKLLLLPSDMLRNALTRQETVALFNTLAKFSDAIAASRELTDKHRRRDVTSATTATAAAAAAATSSTPTAAVSQQPAHTAPPDVSAVSMQTRLDVTVGVIARLARTGMCCEVVACHMSS
jgi:hypothetical protein